MLEVIFLFSLKELGDNLIVGISSDKFSFNKKNKYPINSDAPSKNRKVVIYSTCFVNFNKKNTGVAALKVLKKNGVEVEEAYGHCPRALKFSNLWGNDEIVKNKATLPFAERTDENYYQHEEGA